MRSHWRADRRIPLSTRLALALAGAILLAACSGGELTPQAYFDTLNAQTEVYQESLDTLRDEYGDELSSELDTLHDGTDFSDTSAVDGYFSQSKEVAIVKTADLFSDSAAALRILLDEIEALDPPADLAREHGDAVAAGEALLAAMPLTIEAIRSLDAIDDLTETIEATPYFVANQRFGVACESLETAAVDEGIEIDLSCPESAITADEGEDEGG